MIFVDTSYFHAFFEPLDENHSRALGAAREFRGQRLPDLLITTDFVVMETITLARSRASHRQAVLVGDHLFNEKSARIYRTTFEEQRAAFEILRKYDDKEYSSVDCLSFLVMEKLGITEALTFDSDFSHRFNVRPRL
ncbi:MAG: PIN domain-containing protein [Vicinamibacteria bacterium]